MIVQMKNFVIEVLADLVAGVALAAGFAVFMILPTVSAIMLSQFAAPYLIGNHPSDPAIIWLGFPAIVFAVACLQVKAWNAMHHVLNRWYNAGATES